LEANYKTLPLKILDNITDRLSLLERSKELENICRTLPLKIQITDETKFHRVCKIHLKDFATKSLLLHLFIYLATIFLSLSSLLSLQVNHSYLSLSLSLSLCVCFTLQYYVVFLNCCIFDNNLMVFLSEC